MTYECKELIVIAFSYILLLLVGLEPQIVLYFVSTYELSIHSNEHFFQYLGIYLELAFSF